MSEVAFAVDQRKRPVTGLGLLIVALVISIVAYATAGLGLKGKTPRDLIAYGLAFTVVSLAGVVRRSMVGAARRSGVVSDRGHARRLGIAMLYRIMVDRGEAVIAQEQAIWLIVGVAAFAATLWFVRDDRMLNTYTYTLGLIGVVLLLLPVVPGIGYEINGARCGRRSGPSRFQPAEFGKIFIVVFLAAYLADKRELLASGVGRFGLPRAKDLGPLLVAWIASLAVLFLERDMGASLLFFGVFVVMLWIASGRAGYLWLGIVLFVVGAWLGYLVFDHVQTRVDYWIHALDPAVVTGQGYLPAGAGMVRAGHRRHRGHRHRSGLAHADPVRGQRLHLRGVRRGTRDDRRRLAAPALSWCGSRAGCAWRWSASMRSASCWPPASPRSSPCRRSRSWRG
jgi:hypothetical protein